MTTPCRVNRPGTVTADPVTGADVPTDGAPVFDGSSGDPGCKVQDRQASVRGVESAEATVTTQGLEVHLPVSSGPYRVGDVVSILSGSTVVRRLRMVGTHLKTWQTAQRIPVEEVS